MGAIFYLYRRIFVNRVKMALKKPITYIYLLFVLLYAVMIPFSLQVMLEEYGMDSPSWMAAVLTAFAFWVIPGNLIAYAKRKGLIYRKSDVHFLFSSPVTPKKILLYAHLKNLGIQTVLNLAVAVLGALLFHVGWLHVTVYFVFSILVENLLEGGIMLLLYGAEWKSPKVRQMVVKGAYALVAMFVAVGIYFYITQGLSLASVLNFLNSDLVQMVPVAGWYIAVLHLIFTGPTAVNLAGTAAYFIFLAAVLWAAFRMRCTGAYFEDAMKFADDYEEVLVSRRQGRTDKRLGKRTRYGTARVTYKGTGAKALFYRQLLEYRKSRFFIFDLNTGAALIAGVLIAYLYLAEGGMGELTPFMIPGVSAYVIFIFTTLSGKWAKEIASPYTYLIPDTAFRKLWYATAIQHIQALINGLLLTLPGAVVMGMSPLTAALCVVFYVVLSANKLYALAVAEALTGNILGRVGRQLFQLFIQGIVIGFAFLGAFVGFLAGGLNLAYFLMIVFLTLATVLFMLAAALNFYKLETA